MEAGETCRKLCAGRIGRPGSSPTGIGTRVTETLPELLICQFNVDLGERDAIGVILYHLLTCHLTMSLYEPSSCFEQKTQTHRV